MDVLLYLHLVYRCTCSNSSNGKGEVGTRYSLGDVEMVFAKHTEDKSTQTCFQFTSEFDSIWTIHMDLALETSLT